MFFVDERFIILGTKNGVVKKLKELLLIYEKTSAQKVNFLKYTMYFDPGIPNVVKEDAQRVLGILAINCHEK